MDDEYITVQKGSDSLRLRDRCRHHAWRHLDGDVRRAFVHDVRHTYDRAERLTSCLNDARAELTRRESEIAMLKSMLLELETTDAQGDATGRR